MRKKIIFVFALFLTLTGFRGEERIVEQSNANILGQANARMEGPKILQRLKPVTVKEGGTAVFEVTIEYDPSCEVTWFHGETEIKASSVISITFDGKTARLTIKNVKKEHAGLYTVKIKNRYGVSESTEKLTVQ